MEWISTIHEIMADWEFSNSIKKYCKNHTQLIEQNLLIINNDNLRNTENIWNNFLKFSQSPNKMIKKTARRILNRIAKHLTYDEVSIEHPELISPTAKVRRSQLFGDINVGDFSKLIGARINGKVRIGRWTVLAGPDIDIFSEINSIEIGNFCSIARYVAIQEYNHNAKKITTYFMMRNFFNEGLDFDVTSKGSIFIGNDVWIGAQCIILSGAHISDGCVIGANSVVAGYIPPYSIAVGSPAKVLKSRFDDDMVRKLLAIKWWNWTDDKIKRNKKIFISELTTEIIDQISD